ncbi:MAG: acetylglutamate kinase [Microbacteriaceae bacterium]|nr:acetylglutamate kinase [Microbacteriaceae bacterium]
MMTGSWITALRGKTVVVKFGGNAMTDDQLTRTFCEDVERLSREGIRVVVTHGGGPQISAELAARGIATEFRGGLRVTNVHAVDVVRDVLVRIGADLVTSFQSVKAPALSISGDEHHLIAARRTGTVVDGVLVDLGQVGEVTHVDTSVIDAMIDAGNIPVVSAIARDESSGELLNINADSAASALAIALRAEWLLLLTDVPGLYRDWPNRDSLVGHIDTDEVGELLPRLESGMIPKVTAARDAVSGGVARAAIIDGRLSHSLTSAPLGTTGTTVVPVERNAS